MASKSPAQLSDREFIEQFEACTLPAERFHHREHVKLAWLYLNELPLLQAISRFTAGIKRFATANGKPDRYHETITWAFLLLIHQRMVATKGRSWDEFAAANGDLLDWQENILSRYYRQETLASDLARQTFLMPDRLDNL